MIYKLTGLVFLSFLSFEVCAQRLITGKLVDFYSREPVNEVYVSVYKGTETTISNENGFFQLNVNNDDSLWISHQDYRMAVIPVPEPEVFILYIVKQYSYPEYLNGEASLYQYFRNNMVYPTMAQFQGKEQLLFVQVLVDSTGKLSSCKILNESDKSFEKNVLGVFQSIPGKWSVSQQTVSFIFPVLFKIGLENTKVEIPKIQLPEGKMMEQVIIFANQR